MKTDRVNRRAIPLLLLAVGELNFFQYGGIELADILPPLVAGIVGQAGIEHTVREESYRYISRDFFVGRSIHSTSINIRYGSEARGKILSQCRRLCDNASHNSRANGMSGGLIS